MNDRLFSDEIRERMRRRRRRDLLWSVASFFLHVALFGTIILLTPAKSLVFEEKKEVKDAAKDLSADRIEQIADSLSQARINELLRQLEALQAVLHNMDLMKEELQRDYDAFVDRTAEDMKVTLGNLLNDAERAQKEARENQSPMIARVGRMLAEERQDLLDEERSKWLRENAEQLITVAGDKVGDAQARAGNALDQVQVKAQFGGYRKTAEASEKVRDAQIEAATMQNQAQKEASEIGWRMGDYRGKAKDLENHEKSLAEQRERLVRAEQEKKDAESKLAEAANLRDQAERGRNDAQAEERTNRDEANRRNEEAKLAKSESNRLGSESRQTRRQLEEAKKARDKAAGEQRRVDELEKRVREMESKVAEQDRKAADASLKAREFNAKADESKRLAGERSRVFNDARGRADRERRRVDGSERTANDAKRRIGDLEQKVSERKAAMKGLEEDRKRLVNDEQVNKLKRAAQAQQDIQARIDTFRKILAADEPETEKLARPNRQENELVTADTSSMKMVDAYEVAKQIETAITESYKDVKATQTAIERKISFEAAQKMTDVAKPVRMDAKREVIEDNPRTKEALDAQKIAQTEVVRETDSMVETVVAMMEEAMEIVRPDDGSKMQQARNGRQKVIPWMSDKDFEKRKSEEEQAKRLEQMAEIADFQVAISEAASENENERAKDLTKVMEDAGEVKKNTELADKMQKQDAPRSLQPGGQVVPLDGRMKELVDGNVIRFTPDEKAGGLPAKWVYVRDWYVIGPFPNPNRVNLRRKFPPESVIDLDATYVGKDGKTIRWEFMQTKNATPRESWRGDFKCEIVPFNAEEYGIWYAYAEVICDVACDRWIAVGSDDRSDIWVNDVPVWGSSNKLKSWRADEGYRRIHLNRGRNRILARVENGWHALGWSVCISLEDGDVPPQ